MLYSYYTKKILFSRVQKIEGRNLSLTGVAFEPKFDGVFLRIPREIPVEISPKEYSIKIGKKRYTMTNTGDFTSEKDGIPYCSFMH